MAKWWIEECKVRVYCPWCGESDDHYLSYPVGPSTKIECGYCEARFELETEPE